MSPIDPLTAFLAVIDRLISLIQSRKTRRRDYFEKIVEPLYVQFAPLAEDYLSLFRDAGRRVAGGKRHRKRSIRAVVDKRNAFAHSRDKLRALLVVCESHAQKKKLEDIVSFLKAMMEFFAPMVLTSPGSLGQELVEFFELTTARVHKVTHRPLPPVGPDQLDVYVQKASARLERSWYEISGRFMELKLQYVAD